MAVALGIASAVFGLFVACFTIWLTAPWLRSELRSIKESLDECKRDREDFREQAERLERVLLRWLPADQRAAFAAELAEAS